LAARQVSTTSSTDFTADSPPPTFWPVVQNRQFNEFAQNSQIGLT
jgi:hypothetical protein